MLFLLFSASSSKKRPAFPIKEIIFLQAKKQDHQPSREQGRIQVTIHSVVYKPWFWKSLLAPYKPPLFGLNFFSLSCTGQLFHTTRRKPPSLVSPGLSPWLGISSMNPVISTQCFQNWPHNYLPLLHVCIWDSNTGQFKTRCGSNNLCYTLISHSLSFLAFGVRSLFWPFLR